jgi:hypothetical protein
LIHTQPVITTPRIFKFHPGFCYVLCACLFVIVWFSLEFA